MPTIAWLSHGESDPPSTGEWLTEREAARLARMRYAKRHDEWRLARWTAKQAVTRHLGLPRDPGSLAHVEVWNALDGAPEVRLDGRLAPVSIAMTDRAGWAICTVSEPFMGIGCDLELVEPRSRAFVTDFLTCAEQETVGRAASDYDRHRLANLLWSAKESALKVLRTGLRRDTRSVEVTLPERGPVEGWSPLVVRAVEGRTFPGWWRRYGRFLLTVAATTETPPPVAMVEPPPLAAATPTHSWTARPVRLPPG